VFTILDLLDLLKNGIKGGGVRGDPFYVYIKKLETKLANLAIFRLFSFAPKRKEG
jgi:hypothetical protein